MTDKQELNREVKAICSDHYPWHCNHCPIVKPCQDNHGKDDYNQAMNKYYSENLLKDD